MLRSAASRDQAQAVRVVSFSSDVWQPSPPDLLSLLSVLADRASASPTAAAVDLVLTAQFTRPGPPSLETIKGVFRQEMSPLVCGQMLALILNRTLSSSLVPGVDPRNAAAVARGLRFRVPSAVAGASVQLPDGSSWAVDARGRVVHCDDNDGGDACGGGGGDDDDRAAAFSHATSGPFDAGPVVVPQVYPGVVHLPGGKQLRSLVSSSQYWSVKLLLNNANWRVAADPVLWWTVTVNDTTAVTPPDSGVSFVTVSDKIAPSFITSSFASYGVVALYVTVSAA
jgi:hypothetical protein